MKLILGTANFGPRAYGQLSEAISMNDIREIMTYAIHNGINILESAEAYNCDEILADQRFDLIYKVTNPFSLNRVLHNVGRTHLLGLMYHHGFETQAQRIAESTHVSYTGASIYSHKQLLGSEAMIEVPLNLEDKTFEGLTVPCKLVRSVFGRGELLKKHTVKECLDYVKGLKNVHGVIIGVDSVGQLKEVLEAWK